MTSRHQILLVEDDPMDAAQAVRSVERSGIRCELTHATSGDEACGLLESSPERFSLILLDIKLPKVSGFEVLAHVRNCVPTRLLPVVMLSSSDEPCDIEKAMELGANSYIRKEMDPQLAEASLRIALYYWLYIHRRWERH